MLLYGIIDTENNNPWITDPDEGGQEYVDYSNVTFTEPQADDNACFCREK